MAKTKAIDATAPHAARARHAGPVRERLFEDPVLITFPCFGLLSKALFSACEAACDGLWFSPQSVTRLLLVFFLQVETTGDYRVIVQLSPDGPVSPGSRDQNNASP
jgi:hypothetical protein